MYAYNAHTLPTVFAGVVMVEYKGTLLGRLIDELFQGVGEVGDTVDSFIYEAPTLYHGGYIPSVI